VIAHLKVVLICEDVFAITQKSNGKIPWPTKIVINSDSAFSLRTPLIVI